MNAVDGSKIFSVTDARSQKVIDGFDNFVSRLGLNNDNSLSAGIYTFNLMTRNRVQLEAAYRGSWIVGQVIDTVAEDMTRAGIDITVGDDDSQVKKIQNAMSKLQVWNSLCNLIKWGRLYGGAIAVIQIRGQKLDTPLNVDTVSKGQFEGLVVYDRWQLNPVLTQIIKEGPDMGLPEFYQITTGLTSASPVAPTVTGQITVHHSRVIRGIGVQLPFFQAITEMMWGESILERLWDRLISFDSATMSCANLIERANNRTVGIENLREILAAGGQAQQALESQFDMMRAFQTNEGLTLIDKEDTFASTSYSFAGLSDVMIQFGQQLAGASGIPLVRLFGQSPAGMNSTGESDIRMYYDNINSQQNSRLGIGVEKVLKVMWRSVLGTAAPEDLEWAFVPLWQMTASDKANIGKTNAETILAVHESGLIKGSTALTELRASSDETGLFANITDEEIDEAEEEPPPNPDLTPIPGEPEIAKAEPKGTVDRIKAWLGRKNHAKKGNDRN